MVSHNKKYQPISNWIDATVDPVMLETIQTQLLAEKKRSLQDLIRALKRIYAPSEVSSMTTIQEEYQAILKQAITGSVNPQKWHADWFRAYNRAKLVGLPEVEGVLAAKTFLKAVGARLTPSWSLQEQMDLVKCAELGRDTTSLDDLGRIFGGLAADNAMSGSKKTGVFVTIRARSDIKTSTRSNTKISANETYPCPCKKTDTEKKHPWQPERCAVLELVIKGKTDRHLKFPLTEAYLKGIKSRYELGKWKDLRKEIESTGFQVSSSKSQPTPSSDSLKYPGSINAATIDPLLLSNSSGVYSTLSHSRHPLSLSTLFDNCGAIHLVNDKSLLDPGSFVKANGPEHVEAGTSSLPILGRGTRTFKGIINGAHGEAAKDLVLKDVAVVEGFHVNIISEARLLLSKVWYHGYDCTLRYGDALENVILKKLERKFNLVFIEYKELSSCFNSPFEVPELGTLMFPTL